jgi:hypothetical protein
MRALLLRGFTFAALALAVAGSQPAPTSAQMRGLRSLAVPVDPLITTRIESVLAAANVVVIADYYRIDTRFGPNIRIDALVVDVLDPRTRVKGLRVHVRDPENRNRQEGTSFIDLDELIALSRALPSMAERASSWTHDDRLATELTFTTGGGFRLAIRQSARVPRAFLSTGLLDPVVTSFDIADLATLQSAFDQALTILNSK